jgi:uncharacterized membrane protein YjdF
MKKSHIWILLFNAIYLAIFLIYYTIIDNYEFIWYIFVILVLGLVIGIHLNRVKLDNLILWLLSLWGLMHMIAGGLIIKGQTLYSIHLIDIIDKGGQFYILKMDQAIHFYGFFVSAILIYQLLLAMGSNAPKSPKLMVFIAWIGSMGLGALNEIVEFIAFASFAQTGVGDFFNVELDLVFNFMGALLGAYFAHKKYKRKGDEFHAHGFIK